MIELQKHCNQLGFGGWLHLWDIEHIYKEVSKLEAGQVYLEIGVARGQSLAIASLAAKPGVQVYGIDIINWSDRDENIKKLLDIYDKHAKWNFIEGDSQVEARAWQLPIDVLFIDGDHAYEGVKKDIISWFPHVKSGGTIMFDDFNEKTGVSQAINETIRDHRLYPDQRIDNEMFICNKL